MTHKQKRLIVKGVATPLIIAILLSAVCIPYFLNYPKLPFVSEEAQLAQYGEEEIKQSVSSDDGFEANTIIGSVSIYDSAFPLIFNANEVNANGKLNLMPYGALAGKTGTAYMELYKNDSAKLKLIGKGDIITISTYYGEYEYKVYDTRIINGLNSVKGSSTGLGNSLVIYTDNSMQAGISEEYFTVICTLERSSDL